LSEKLDKLKKTLKKASKNSKKRRYKDSPTMNRELGWVALGK
jgi:hypothetical protein